MKKILKVFAAVICLLAISTVGFANATPRPLKEANMVYWTSDDSKMLPVPGNQVSDFKLTLNENTDQNYWYYLNIKFVKPTLPAGYYMFWLSSPPDTDTAFWNYWAAKGVTALAPHFIGGVLNWQWVMWRIIHGAFPTQLPMFALFSDGDNNYKLCDGLQRFAFGMTQATLRVNGDYPKGTYVFTCLAAVDPSFVTIANVLTDDVMAIEFR